MTVCFCTLAIHAPYRERARLLCSGAATVPWVVLTDKPGDFADLPVRAIWHAPTGPMAVDYLARLPPTGDGRGAAAYHDKRFAIFLALQGYDTAIYVDADTRIHDLPSFGVFPAGLSVLPIVTKSVAEHLDAPRCHKGRKRISLLRNLVACCRISTGPRRLFRRRRRDRTCCRDCRMVGRFRYDARFGLCD
jgi:hypothetical protein